MAYLLRSFSSFNPATREVAVSRIYEGIRYRAAVEIGIDQGENFTNYENSDS